MTDIYEYINHKKKATLKKDISVAEQLFLDNIGHIETISKTKGFEMIKNHWIAQGNKALSELNNLSVLDIAELSKAKAKLELSTEFVRYLTAHEKGLS